MVTRTAALFTEATAISVPQVLIVDDSAVARAVIARTIDMQGRYAVAGAVSDAHAALAFLADHRVDVILLDIELPGIDGLTALPDLIAAGRGARVLIVSSSCGENAATTIQALTLGAADTLVKPSAGELAGRFATILDAKLARLLDDDYSSLADEPVQTSAPVRRPDFDIVAIGASTGGIHALSHLLRAIPASFQTPILVTQHLPESFMPYFAAQLAVLVGRPCDVAVDFMAIKPGRIMVAPGDAHIHCVAQGDRVIVQLGRENVPSGCRPSVDPMFATVAKVYGRRALAIVLSGMGRDGTDGARRVAAAGGVVVAQDKASSVVWGMPGSVVQEGLARLQLHPDDIGRLVASQRRPSC
ncbi:chemotaxis protein CheB [Sphingomonas sp. GlSt437]|uniref:chemotaxis protein CheB n=1 Tax=Sphingomonas sp. GlSt437 TaxID=3389970 RepID=UPI003A8A707C